MLFIAGIVAPLADEFIHEASVPREMLRNQVLKLLYGRFDRSQNDLIILDGDDYGITNTEMKRLANIGWNTMRRPLPILRWKD